MIVTLLAATFACLGVPLIIDVSTLSDGLEPEHDERSVSDNVLVDMERSTDPCDNFYEYKCGSWLLSTNLPPDRTSNYK